MHPHLWSWLLLVLAACFAGAAESTTVVLAGVARNVDVGMIRAKIPALIRLGEAFERYHIVVYENDSPSLSRTAFREELARTPHSTFLFEDGIAALFENFSLPRTARIAFARNKLLEVVHRDFSHYEFLVMTDMDDLCGDVGLIQLAFMCGNGKLSKDEHHELNFWLQGYRSRSYNISVFKSAIARSSEWDVLSFRAHPYSYWDLWAFRHNIYMPHNILSPLSHLNEFSLGHGTNCVNSWINSNHVDRWLSNHSSDELITVESAFMMLAMYKISKTGASSCEYLGFGFNGEPDCEHVAFHRCLLEGGAKIRIMPVPFCGPWPEFLFFEDGRAAITRPSRPQF